MKRLLFGLFSPDAAAGSGDVQTLGLPPGSTDAAAPASTTPPAPTPVVNPAHSALAKAKDWLAHAVRAARAIGITDQNIIGLLENGFEDARNAVAGNTATKEKLAAAAKALEAAAGALANHSSVNPADLTIVRNAVEATRAAADKIQ